MIDRQTLFEQFLDSLGMVPPVPDYVEKEPEAIAPFDPYQLVAEWITLRHEVKQQGKLLQATQQTLQQALNMLQSEKEQMQQQLKISQKQEVVQIDQKALWRDLLTVMDALDQACAHWQAQLDDLTPTPLPPPHVEDYPFWQRWMRKLTPDPIHETMPSSSLQEVLLSSRQGVDLIRRSLLDILRQRQVVPIMAQGQPFNAQTMYAIGRQESTSVPDNTVIQEVVHGYLWGDQVLREAQVIVAAKQT